MQLTSIAARPAAERTPRSVAANSLWLLIAQLGSRLLALGTPVVITRALGVESYGQFAIAFALAAFFAPLFDFGMELPALRAIVREPQRSGAVLGAALLARLAFAALLFPLALASTTLLPGGPPPGLAACALLAALLNVLIGSYTVVFRAWRRMDLECFAGLGLRLVATGATLGVAWRGGGLLALGAAQAAAAAIGLLLVVTIAARRELAPSWRAAGARSLELVRAGAPFVGTALLVTLSLRIDMLILAAVHGNRSVGLYGCATQLLFSCLLFSQALVGSVVPVVASGSDLADPRSRGVLRGALAASLAISVGLAAAIAPFAPWVLRVLYGAEYVGAARSLTILMTCLPVLFATNLLGHCLGALGRQALVLRVSALNAVVNVALNLVLIPALDLDGASLATLATELTGLAAYGIALRGELRAVLGFRRSAARLSRSAASNRSP